MHFFFCHGASQAFYITVLDLVVFPASSYDKIVKIRVNMCSLLLE